MLETLLMTAATGGLGLAGIVGAAIASGLVLWLSHRQQTHQAWGSLRLAFHGAGLELTETTVRFVPVRATSRATSGSLDVHLRPGAPDAQGRVTLRLDACLDPELKLLVQFGEERWSVLGDEAFAAGLASGRLRSAVGPGDELHLAEGSLTLLLAAPSGAGAAALALDHVAARLGRFVGPDRVRELLVDTLRADPDPVARADVVPHLLAREPSWADAAARDPSPLVRLAVARAVRGELGFALAAAIVKHEILHPDLQRGAARWLTGWYPPEQVVPVLVAALRAADDDVVSALVTAIGAAGERAAVDALRAELPTAEARTAARIVEGLVALDGPGAEPELCGILRRWRDRAPRHADERELAGAVIDGLGKVGGRAALPGLRRLQAHVPPLSELGLATQIALDLVLYRAGDVAAAGALALAELDPPNGELSLP